MNPAVRVVDLGYGFAAAAAAMLAMTGVAAAGVALIGAGTSGPAEGSPMALTAATVLLATGGALELSAHLPGLPLPVTGHGELALRPLGVSLAGAAALGAALLLPLRGRTVTAAGLAVRAGAAAAGVVALVAVASALAGGELVVPVEDAAGPADELVLGFTAGTGRALAGAVGWVLVVLGCCWLGSGRAPVPAAWRRWRDPLRQAAVAAFVAAAAAVVLIVATTAAAAAVGDDGAVLLGAALLAAPTVLVVLVTLGLGGQWGVSLAGPLAEPVGARLAELGVAGPITAGWQAVLVAVVVLLGCGLLAGRIPVSASGIRAAGIRAGWLGPVLGVAVLSLAALAQVTARAELSLAGAAMPLVAAELRTGLLLAGGLGLGGGLVAGFLGSLAAESLRKHRVAVRMLDSDD